MGEGGRCQALESGPGGSLRASRVFTNEGSKKEKRGLEGQADPPRENRPKGGVPLFPFPSRGVSGAEGAHLSREEVTAPAHPAVTPPSEAPAPVV